MKYSPGQLIYKYQLIQKIGGGAFGEVWTANDNAIKTQLAVKLLDQAHCSIDERLLEAQIGNRLIHPNVVNIRNADVVNIDSSAVPIVIIAMPFYHNGSVASKINSANFLDLDKALCCLIDVLRGLEYLHENGYYHCDIKPQNILVGELDEYVLTDYGITCHSPTHTAVSPRSLYLPHTAAESIAYNRYDVRTDIYQLGLTAFRLINGISMIKDEFAKDPEAFQQKVLDGKVVADKDFQPFVPRKLRRIILKACSANPEKRFQSALEMRRELERISLYGGTATSNEHGRITILKKGYAYFYETAEKDKKCVAFMAFKENLTSHRKTRIVKYSCQLNNPKDIRKAAQRFFLSLL